MADDTPDTKRSDGKTPRKPYAPPRILSRERLEAVAGTCTGTGKTNSTQCPVGPIAS